MDQHQSVAPTCAAAQVAAAEVAQCLRIPVMNLPDGMAGSNKIGLPALEVMSPRQTPTVTTYLR